MQAVYSVFVHSRTEYWKSQARKYCEFCKCWLADNKVSISFHENGKRHKENVQKHVSQVSKKGAKDFKKKEKMEDDIKKMEEAAMAAYLKDVQNNADLTSQSINEMLGESTSKTNPGVISKEANCKTPPTWHEVKNDDGSSYYWNIETNETTWEPPDKYLSIAEQEEQKMKNVKVVKKKLQIKKEKQKEALIENKAHLAREKMKELNVEKVRKKEVKNETHFGPSPRAAVPFGSWTPVVKESTEQVDFQLPKTKELPPPPVELEPEVIQFKEKRVESLGDGPVEFKKRKFNNHKRNMRQKVDDD